MEIIPILKRFGLNEKEVAVYLTLLEEGPLSVRGLSQKSKVNRGTAYDILKSLKALGLVSYYHKETKQFFAAEDPEKLEDALEDKKHSFNEIAKEVQKVIPELKLMYNQSGKKPVVKYYEGERGTKVILQDIISTISSTKDKTYYIFSSSTIRPHIHKAWPAFTEERIKKSVHVHVVAIGHTGTPAELSHRKSLTEKEGVPTYIFIYEGKVAMISLNDKKKLLGLIIEDKAIFQTQLQLFKFIWQSLK